MLRVLQKTADHRGRPAGDRLEFGVDLGLTGGGGEDNAVRCDQNAIVFGRVLPFVSVAELPARYPARQDVPGEVVMQIDEPR
jgi:hypothetical protein